MISGTFDIIDIFIIFMAILSQEALTAILFQISAVTWLYADAIDALNKASSVSYSSGLRNPEGCD